MKSAIILPATSGSSRSRLLKRWMLCCAAGAVLAGTTAQAETELDMEEMDAVTAGFYSSSLRFSISSPFLNRISERGFELSFDSALPQAYLPAKPATPVQEVWTGKVPPTPAPAPVPVATPSPAPAPTRVVATPAPVSVVAPPAVTVTASSSGGSTASSTTSVVTNTAGTADVTGAAVACCQPTASVTTTTTSSGDTSSRVTAPISDLRLGAIGERVTLSTSLPRRTSSSYSFNSIGGLF